tara:strand:- start:1379 stop:1669 length:291 start_codon:yes stop_codon:yes gene_type:complete
MKKIKISKTSQNKKNFLKENCASSAAPMSALPMQTAQSPVDMLPLENLTPQEAFDAGYSAAINEIMEIISEMVPGGVPIDMDVPEDIAALDQLEES